MKRVFAGLLLLVGMAVAGAWWWTKGSVPQLDGEWRLAGLGGPVEVLSDLYGVPHVYARDTSDVWFVAGALHARDRLWQMELYRRAASGRLSEVLGEATLAIDKRMLTLGIPAAADAEFAKLSPAALQALTRYADGVNAVASGLGGRQRPLEFQVLGLTPAPWTPRDSLAIGRLLAFRLAENQSAELVRHALSRAVGAENADRLTGAYPADGPTVIGELAESAPPPDAASPIPAPAPGSEGAAAPAPPPARISDALAWLLPTSPRANSNAWVVAGTRTATGRPLLANDPHLTIEMPGVWYEMHLVAAGLDVQGVGVPGTPFVAIGHNARVAWGFTNTGADVQDFTVETIDLGARRVQTGSGWEPVTVEPQPIPVKGRSAPAAFELWRTANGVVYADESLEWDAPPAWLSPDGGQAGQQRALVLRWSGFDGHYANAFESLNRAANWDDFQAALDGLTALSQNAIYADVDGNIGYLMTGQVPVRTTGDGTRPLPRGASAWAGVIGGPGALPRLLNPSRGFLVSSNNPVRRGGPFVTHDWAAPYRAARITAVLSAASAIDIPAVTALQRDVESAAARDVLQGLDGGIAKAKASGAEPRAVALLERLRGWNHRIDGSREAALYEVLEDHLWQRTFADDLPPELFRRYYQWAGAERVAGLYAIVDQPSARWWDDIGTVDRTETRDDIFVLAAIDAAADVARWNDEQRGWEGVHSITFAHPLAAGSRVLDWFFSRGPVPVVGDGMTVMRISHKRLAGFGAWEHPSWRQVLDVGGWDSSLGVLPNGQSGHPRSPNYFDQNELWRQGQYRPLPYTRAAVNGAATHRQLLTP